MSAANPTARLEARISPDLHALLKRAAELQPELSASLIKNRYQGFE